MLQRIRHTDILSKFKITSKLLAVKSCAYFSKLPGTKFEGSVVQLKVPCVKRQEGLCYFDCSIFCFDHRKLSWYNR